VIASTRLNPAVIPVEACAHRGKGVSAWAGSSAFSGFHRSGLVGPPGPSPLLHIRYAPLPVALMCLSSRRERQRCRQTGPLRRSTSPQSERFAAGKEAPASARGDPAPSTSRARRRQRPQRGRQVRRLSQPAGVALATPATVASGPVGIAGYRKGLSCSPRFMRPVGRTRSVFSRSRSR
jgi:hypothetical protein